MRPLFGPLYRGFLVHLFLGSDLNSAIMIVMNRTTKLYLWLAFAAIFFMPFFWYEGSKLIIGGDLTFPLNPAEYFVSIFHIWRPVFAGTDSAISLTTLPFYAPMALFDWLGFSLQTVQKLHFGLWLAVPALSMFYLAGVLFKAHPRKLTIQLIATSIYLFNTYQVVWADSARMSLWIAMPLTLAFFIQGLDDKKGWWRWALLIALTSIIASPAAVNPPLFLVFIALFFLWLIYHFISQPASRTKSELKRIGLFVGLTLLASILVNFYWIIPYGNFLLNDYKNAVFTNGVKGIDLQNWLDPLSTNTSLLNVFRLQGAWDWYAGWAGEPYVPAAASYQRNVFYLIWSVLVPILAFSSLLLKPKKVDSRLILGLVLLALIGIFVGAGSHQPTGTIYKWLVEKIPFLSIYRSPWYKFTLWTVLAYSLLGGISAATLLDTVQERLPKLVWKSGLAVAIGLFLIANTLYASGLVFGKVFPKPSERKVLQAAHVNFPDYFFKAADWINQQPGDWRILQLPATPSFNYSWGLGTLMDMSIFAFHKPTYWYPEQVGSGKAKAGAEAVVKKTFNELYIGRYENLSRMLGLLNIKYLLEKDDIDYTFYGSSDSPQLVRQKLAAQGLKSAHKEGEWEFFETKSEDQKKLIFPTTSFVATAPGIDGLFAAIHSKLYDPNATYVDTTITSNYPGSSSRYTAPDIDKTEAHDQSLRMPITVTESGHYWLTFTATDIDTVTISFDGQPLTFTSENGVAKSQELVLESSQSHYLDITPNQQAKNLVQNPSFEDGIWEKPFDASAHRSGEAGVEGSIVADGTDGQHAVRLSTKNHAAAIRHGIDEFEVDRYYHISFDYKYSYGEAPEFSIWQEGAGATEPAGKLPKNNQWTRYNTILKPQALATTATLFLYANDTDKKIPTEAFYDNVRIVKFPQIIDTLALVTETPPASPIPELTYHRLSSTHYQVTVKNARAPYILNFLEKYDTGWEAAIEGHKLKTDNHKTAFGYANSWYIDGSAGQANLSDPENYRVDLYFRPQTKFAKAVIVSVVSIGLILVGLWQARQKKRFS